MGLAKFEIALDWIGLDWVFLSLMNLNPGRHTYGLEVCACPASVYRKALIER